MIETIISFLSFKIRFIKNVRADVIYRIKNIIRIICGIIIFIILVYSNHLLKNEWPNIGKFLGEANPIKGNEIAIFLCMVSVAFITISITSIVANKTIIIYWINVVEHDLIKPVFNYFVISCYIFISLLAALIGVLIRDSIVLGISFIVELFFMIFLSLRVIYVYFGTYHRRLRLEKKYRRELNKALKLSKASKVDIRDTEEIWITNHLNQYYDDLLTNIVLLQNSCDLITERYNLDFFIQNILFIPNSRVIRLIGEVDDSLKMPLMLDIIDCLTAFMHGFSISKQNERCYIFGDYYFYEDIRKYRTRINNDYFNDKRDDVLELFFYLIDINNYNDSTIRSLKKNGKKLGWSISYGIEAYYNLAFNIFDEYFVKSTKKKTSYKKKAEAHLKRIIKENDIDDGVIDFMIFIRKVRNAILQIMLKIDYDEFYKELYENLLYYSKLFEIVNSYLENTPSVAKQVYSKVGRNSFIEEYVLKEAKANKKKVYKIIQ